MLNSTRPIGFVPVTDLPKAREFYAGTLGFDVEDENPFALVLRCGTTMIRATKVDAFTPQPFTVLGWQVDDIDEAVDTLKAQGIGFLFVDGLDQSSHGIWTTPGGDRVAWFKDPFGNTLSVSQFV
ncbi:VOC family protein [Amycolatopsis sp. NPDC059657]|uniref:VOC family protein n=1 Tax=Amycolatopsis sp. NPDC059657 TaxID=3346899 RepID=UPI0036706376